MTSEELADIEQIKKLKAKYLRPGRKDESFGYYEDEHAKVSGVWKILAINCHLYPAVAMAE